MELVVSYNMKYLVLLFVCVLVNHSTQQNPPDAVSRDIINQCIKDFLVTDARKPSGEFTPDLIKSLSDPTVEHEELSEFIDQCGKSMSMDICHTAYDVVKCIFTETQKQKQSI